MKSDTPISDILLMKGSMPYTGKIYYLWISKSLYQRLIKTKEFITLFNEHYPNGADMTFIRVQKVLKEKVGLKRIFIR